MNKNVRNLLMILLVLLVLIVQPHHIFAQDNQGENPADNSMFEQSSESSEVTIILGNENNESNNSQLNNGMQLNFKNYVPYAKFVNYQYQGDGTLFVLQDIIMEYPPDMQGIFQVTSFTENRAVAYIYQIRDNGMYELAYFDNYNVVEDLRYTAIAQDGSESLIIPNNLSVGHSFQSGYHQEIKRTIVEILNVFNLGGYNFQNVVKILEQNPNSSDSFYYYFAPDYGIILVEKMDANGNIQPFIQLISTQGNIMP